MNLSTARLPFLMRHILAACWCMRKHFLVAVIPMGSIMRALRMSPPTHPSE
jgi:hypothetical protein